MLILDCCLLPCPQPIMRCKEGLTEFCPEEIEVLVDNKPAVENVTRFLEKNNYQVLVNKKEENIWSLHGRNTCTPENKHDSTLTNTRVNSALSVLGVLQTNVISENVTQGTHKDSALAFSHLESNTKTVIFLTSDYIGHGDDVLGEKLMSSFLSCLKEMNLWQIILLNGGVRLTTKAGKDLEHLQELEASGVRILVCGACLSHYGLYEEKKVGGVTNMLDIITALELADKVIRP